jgi:hypothetical protein
VRADLTRTVPSSSSPPFCPLIEASAKVHHNPKQEGIHHDER